MAKSFTDIKKQIAQLEAEAAKALNQEKVGVISRIKVAIAEYGLTAADVFAGKAAKAGKGAKAAKSVRDKPRTTYSNGQGGTWGGLGKRPDWLRAALAAGKKLEEFAVGVRPAADQPVPAAPEASKKTANGAMKGKGSGAKRPIKYKDNAGNVWTGSGLKPRWLSAAIAAGKKPEDFKV